MTFVDDLTVLLRLNIAGLPGFISELRQVETEKTVTAEKQGHVSDNDTYGSF